MAGIYWKRRHTYIYHSDLHAVNGDWPLATKLPLVGGHEGAGVVVALGSLVEDIKVGDYAGVKVCTFQVTSDFMFSSDITLSGSTALAAHVASANNPTSRYVRKPS